MNASNPSTIIFDSTAELQQAVAEAASDLILKIVAEKGIARISLSGGSTPRRIYELKAERDLP
ncbi:MAG: 6-phosphogluconolactonase, partial [Planctomycetota bacterium]|nr:6-phosphogluconolactonase [Planctomycetota bacterium]